jgi:EXPERA (EXPanded EBP superfamily)
MTISPAATTTEAAAVRSPIPLRDRRYDWFFIVVFTMFIGSSFTGDIVNMVGRPDPDSDFFLARLVYHVYADGTDPLLIANPRFLQVGASVSAVVFGTFYVLLVYSFIRGREWIRRPSFIYTGMVVQTTFIVVMVGFAGDARLFQAVCNTAYDYTFTNVPKALAYNLPYIIVPILLTARMWRPHPFTRLETPRN